MKEQILIVDDEKLMLTSYSLFFQEKYDITLAENAEDALKILEKKSNFAVVLSDFDMPGMNGIELLNKIKVSYPDITRVLMTAITDITIVSNAVNESNIFRFLIKNDDIQKFEIAIKDAIEFHRVLKNEKKLRAELQSTYDKLEKDLKAAAQLQQDIQPPASTIDGYSFVPLFMPSEFLSGDNFNYFQFQDWIFFYVLDVTGSGIPASMMSFTISKLLNSDQIPTNPILEFKKGRYVPKSPKTILKELNKIFLTKDEDFQFFTILFGIIDINEGKVSVANGGNRRPILMNSNVHYLDVKGLPIGALDDSEFTEKKVDFNVGDKLIVYTDGICELRNPKEEMYSDERFLGVLEDHQDQNVADIINILNNETLVWCGDEKVPDDDITILAIERVS